MPTEAGLVSGYMDATSVFGAGLLSPNPAGAYSQQANLTGYDVNAWRNFTRLDQAWLEFAGFTAGRAQSVFDFYADAYNLIAAARLQRPHRNAGFPVFAHAGRAGGAGAGK